MFGTSNQEIQRIPQFHFHKAPVKYLFLGQLEALNLRIRNIFPVVGNVHINVLPFFYM